jgi:hypothetical protein
MESPSVITVTVFEAIKTFSELSKVLRAKLFLFLPARGAAEMGGSSSLHRAANDSGLVDNM